MVRSVTTGCVEKKGDGHEKIKRERTMIIVESLFMKTSHVISVKVQGNLV
jgi:hypothetical protein